MTPFFSIIMPVYNRERFVARTIRSCLAQDFEEFEIIAVDDASQDDSARQVLAFDDQRIRLLSHTQNRGQCPARNTAMSAAAGSWFLFLDSDDELTPGALRRIHARALEVDPDVGAMRFMCRDDAGRLSPDPPHPNEIWDYEQYGRWMDRTRHGLSEALPCVRASTYPEVRYPDDRSEEGLYHLDVARRWRVGVFDDVVRLYHQDANDRITGPNARRALLWAPAAAANVDVVLQRHGAMLQRVAPGTHRDMLLGGIHFSLLSGDRRRALAYAGQYRQLARLPARAYAILGAGLVHGRVLASLQHAKVALRERRAGRINA